MQQPNSIIADLRDITAALKRLCRKDARLAAASRAFARAGIEVPLRREPPGFESLVRLIVYQQISLKAAAAIWQRIDADGAVTPASILKGGGEALGAAGLSRPKIRYALQLAEAVISGHIDFANLETLPDAEARKALMRQPGIGGWTADLYLLQALGRRDILPAQDLALQESARAIYGLALRPSPEALLRIAAPWSPDRSVAARLLWSYYRLMRQDPAAAARLLSSAQG